MTRINSSLHIIPVLSTTDDSKANVLFEIIKQLVKKMCLCPKEKVACLSSLLIAFSKCLEAYETNHAFWIFFFN